MRKVPEHLGTEIYGGECRDGDETYKHLMSSETLFLWGYKTMGLANRDSPGDDFLEALDAKLAPHGLEVVKVGFNGDMYLWTVEPKAS